jgi:uncharacterized protein with HEPN domain
MTEKGEKYLSDILQSINLIEIFMSDVETFDAYQKDLKTQSAVERQLGIIGEAVNKFKQTNPEEILDNTKEIIGFRNRLIHAYDSVDNSIIWVIVKKYLKPLKETILSKEPFN